MELQKRRRRWLAALLLAGCTDPVAPRPTTQVTICVSGADWVAYQNDGHPWTHLGASGIHAFMATPRVAIARARFQSNEFGSGSRIFVDYLTAEQANAQFQCGTLPEAPDGMIGGSIVGADGFAFANVYFNGIGAYVPAGQHTWGMEAQAVPATLLAARYDTAANRFWADRVIILRDQSYLPGTLIPAIDFASDEAFAPSVHTVSFAATPMTSASVWYHTGGREHFLSSVPPVDETPGSAPIYSIPASRLADGDMHVLILSTIDNRHASRYFRVGADFTLNVGPPLATPTITTVATQPYRRMRAELPWQPEYGASVELGFAQLTENYDRSSEITLRATREYFGGAPTVWSLTVPDLSGVAGFQMIGLFADGPFGWFARAGSTHFGLDDRNAEDGETTVGAFRQGTSP